MSDSLGADAFPFSGEGSALYEEEEEAEGEAGEEQEGEEGVEGVEAAGDGRDQDRYLPIANISRIMKKVLPANAKIAREAKETVQMCVSEFISFVTSEASDKCLREKRKTINGDDLLWALMTLGFENYVEALRVYLQKYREVAAQRPDRPGKRQRREED